LSRIQARNRALKRYRGWCSVLPAVLYKSRVCGRFRTKTSRRKCVGRTKRFLRLASKFDLAYSSERPELYLRNSSRRPEMSSTLLQDERRTGYLPRPRIWLRCFRDSGRCFRKSNAKIFVFSRRVCAGTGRVIKKAKYIGHYLACCELVQYCVLPAGPCYTNLASLTKRQNQHSNPYSLGPIQHGSFGLPGEGPFRWPIELTTRGFEAAPAALQGEKDAKGWPESRPIRAMGQNERGSG